MKCEEFEAIGLERPDKRPARDAARAEAAAHANGCSRCAALQESWQEARAGLQALRAVTRDAQASQRVEARLRQEFRTTHRTRRMRSAAVFAAWALAAAAVLLGAISWWNWRLAQSRRTATSAGNIVKPGASTPGVGGRDAGKRGESAEEPPLVAENAR